MYKYFTKRLLEKSNEIDLASIFAEKQQMAKERLNTNYSLPQIVDWLKASTNNFKKSDGYFIDLDEAIRRLVYKYYDSTNQANPFVDIDVEEITKGEPRKPVEVGTGAVKSETTEAVNIVVNNAQDEIQQLNDAIEYLQAEADSGDEEAKEALEYIKDELKSLTAKI